MEATPSYVSPCGGPKVVSKPIRFDTIDAIVPFASLPYLEALLIYDILTKKHSPSYTQSRMFLLSLIT